MTRFVLVTLGILGLMILRRPGGFTLPTFYFEDGTTFYAAQVIAADPLLALAPFTHGFLGDSYSLLLARGAALAAWAGPPRLAPYVMNGVGFLAVALSCAVFSLSRFRFLVQSDGLRVIFAVLAGTVLDGGEFLGNATNCFWALAIPAALLSAAPPASSPACSVALGLALSLATPLSAVVLPFAVWSARKGGRTAAAAFPAAVVIGGLIQIALGSGVLDSGGGGGGSGVGPAPDQAWNAALNGFSYHVVLPAFFGYGNARALMASGLGVGAAAAICVLGLFAAKRFVPEWGSSAIWTVYFLLAPLLLALFRREQWWALVDAGPAFVWAAPRYYYLSRVVLVFMVLAILGKYLRAPPASLAAGVLLFAVCFRTGFVLPEKAATGVPSWSGLAAEVAAWEQEAVDVRPGRRELPIFEPPDWSIVLPGIAPAPFSSQRASEWKGSFDMRGESLVLDSTHGSAWTEIFLPAGRALRIRVKTRERCAPSSASRIELRLRDTYQGFASDALRKPHCSDLGTLEAALPAGRRRGVRIELRYAGAGTAEMLAVHAE